MTNTEFNQIGEINQSNIPLIDLEQTENFQDLQQETNTLVYSTLYRKEFLPFSSLIDKIMGKKFDPDRLSRDLGDYRKRNLEILSNRDN